MPGRKRIEQLDWPRIQFRIPPEYKKRIVMYGADHGLSIAEVVMRMVDRTLPEQFGKYDTTNNRKRPKSETLAS